MLLQIYNMVIWLINNNIYMKIPNLFKLFEANNTKPYNMYLIKLQWYLYKLK